MNHMTHNQKDFDPAYMRVEGFAGEECDCCYRLLSANDDRVYINRYTANFSVVRCVCEDCLHELRYLGRKVSEMTAELITENWLRKESETMNDFRNLINQL